MTYYFYSRCSDCLNVKQHLLKKQVITLALKLIGLQWDCPEIKLQWDWNYNIIVMRLTRSLSSDRHKIAVRLPSDCYAIILRLCWNCMRLPLTCDYHETIMRLSWYCCEINVWFPWDYYETIRRNIEQECLN